ncbi:unnamed protein product [Moneuplotes crassus]|uniref:Uncharacterized protein n=1 Tax=Euplotes crassus TaxID=5936 RepID=A0AAD2D3A1_EUPCR|nr:unnamed protein product [Moneuplotes crassus]
MEALEPLNNIFPTEKDTQFLINYLTKDPVPLYYVENIVTINNSIAEIKFVQYYYNDATDFIETEYVFPVHNDCTFTGLEARFEDQLIVSTIKSRERAKAEYDDAIAKGDTAFIAHPCRKSKDMIRIQMGNLPPKSQIIITCYFHQVMEVEDLSWKLHIPSKIIPRYMGDLDTYVKTGKHLKGMVKSMHNDTSEQRQEDIEEEISGYYNSNSFNWTICVNISSQSPIRRLISPSHDIKTEFSDDTQTNVCVQLCEPGLDSFFDKDFVLLYRSEDINTPMILMQKKNDEYALMVSMLVDLTSKEELEQRKDQIYEYIDLDPKIKYQKEIKNTMVSAEFTFVLDRSYSMEGDSIETAKEALLLFLHSLPLRSRFDVVSFGSTFESIFEGTVEYNQETMNKACEIIKDFKADLGGTEIFDPLHSIFADRDDSNGLTKHVFLLTDGAVFDPEQCVELIENNSGNFTVHTFGIGNGVSTQLITECARAGKGKHYFVKNPTSGLERSVIDALCKCFQTKLIIQKKDLAANGDKLFEQPPLENLNSRMYHGEYFTYFCIVNGVDGDELKGSLSLHTRNIEDTKAKKLLVDLKEDVKLIPGDFIFKMFCKHHNIDLQRNMDNIDLVAKLSIKYQIPSRFTSFIASKKLVSKSGIEYKNVKSDIPNKRVQFEVKTLTGKSINIDMLNSETIHEVKEIIFVTVKVPADQQRLIFGGKQLEDSITLSEYFITNGSVLHLVLSLRAGGGLTIKNMITKIENNVECDYDTLKFGELLSQIARMFYVNEGKIKVFINGRRINPSRETEIRKVGIESGVKVEFYYPHYKNYVNIQKVDGSWDEQILQECDKTEEEVLKSIYYTEHTPENVKNAGDKEEQLKIMYTWIGINRVKTLFPSYEREWKLVVNKAADYIEKETNFGGKYEDINSDLFEKEDEEAAKEKAKEDEEFNKKLAQNSASTENASDSTSVVGNTQSKDTKNSLPNMTESQELTHQVNENGGVREAPSNDTINSSGSFKRSKHQE